MAMSGQTSPVDLHPQSTGGGAGGHIWVILQRALVSFPERGTPGAGRQTQHVCECCPSGGSFSPFTFGP